MPDSNRDEESTNQVLQNFPIIQLKEVKRVKSELREGSVLSNQQLSPYLKPVLDFAKFNNSPK